MNRFRCGGRGSREKAEEHHRGEKMKLEKRLREKIRVIGAFFMFEREEMASRISKPSFDYYFCRNWMIFDFSYCLSLFHSSNTNY